MLDRLLPLCAEAADAAEAYAQAARAAVRNIVAPKGKVDAGLLNAEQFAAHGFAWIATYAAGLRQMLGWGERLKEAGQFGELEQLILQAAFGEYLNQMQGGIAISQVEIVRPGDLGLDAAALDTPAVRKLIASNTAGVRMRIAALIASTPATSAPWSWATTRWKRSAASSAASSTAKCCPMPMSGT